MDFSIARVVGNAGGVCGRRLSGMAILRAAQVVYCRRGWRETPGVSFGCSRVIKKCLFLPDVADESPFYTPTQSRTRGRPSSISILAWRDFVRIQVLLRLVPAPVDTRCLSPRVGPNAPRRPPGRSARRFSSGCFSRSSCRQLAVPLARCSTSARMVINAPGMSMSSKTAAFSVHGGERGDDLSNSPVIFDSAGSSPCARRRRRT